MPPQKAVPRGVSEQEDADPDGGGHPHPGQEAHGGRGRGGCHLHEVIECDI